MRMKTGRNFSKVLGACAVIVALAGPAWAQGGGPAKYGEPDKVKTPAQIAAEKEAESAYRRSLGNIPEQKSTDPWGTVRSDSAPPKAAVAPKPKAKSPDTKSADTKTGAAAKQ